MKIKNEYLTPNDWSRPETPLKAVLGIVMHWTANANANAMQNRDYFEARKTGMNSYGSAHYIVSQDGEIVACVPETEIAYHCGSGRIDPASGRVYTDEARRRFGSFTGNNSSPNHCTIGVELCPKDEEGNFTDATIAAAVELCADICRRHGLTAADITTHHDVVGWKECPLLWTKKPQLLEAFRASVENELIRS